MDSFLTSLFSEDCKTAVDIAGFFISILASIIGVLLVAIGIALRYIFNTYTQNNSFELEIFNLKNELKITQMLIDKEKI